MIRIAVVGYGYWGPNLVRNVNQNVDSSLTACCELSAERRKAVADLYPEVRLVANFDDLLNAGDIDAIIVATPVRTHFDLAKRALQHGKHVLVEKPMAMSSAEASELIELDSVDIAAANTPAISKPRTPVGSASMMNVAKISSDRSKALPW